MVRHTPFCKLSLIRFSPNDATRAQFTGKDAFARFGRIIGRNYSNRDSQIALDLFLNLTRPVPVSQGKAAVDFRFRSVLRREKIVEVFLRIYLMRTKRRWIKPTLKTVPIFFECTCYAGAV